MGVQMRRLPTLGLAHPWKFYEFVYVLAIFLGRHFQGVQKGSGGYFLGLWELEG